MGYNVPYVSHMKALLAFKGIFDMKPGVEIKRDVWDTYPIYLQHTVFQEGGDMDKIRKMEIGHRFFIVDHFKERANKRMNKGHYDRAIMHFEKGVSCLKWLSCEVDMETNPFDMNAFFKDFDKIKDVDQLKEKIETTFKVETDKSDTESTKEVPIKEKKEEKNKEKCEDPNCPDF